MSTVSAVNAATPTATSSTAAATATTSLASEQTFLKLLLAQLKNQNPLNPVDSTQFVTQLAQYSSLEQLIGIKQDADKIITPAAK